MQTSENDTGTPGTKGSPAANQPYRQSVLNTLLLLLFISVPLIEVTHFLLVGPQAFEYRVLLLSIIFIGMIGIIWLINRLGFVDIAAYALVITLMAALFMGLWFFPAADRPLFYNYLILPIILISILFSKQLIAITALAEIIVLIWASFRIPDIDIADTPIILIALTAVLLIFISHMRDRVEQERQRHVESEDLRQETLHRIDSAILAANSSQEVGEAALESLRELLDYDRASVTIYEKQGDEVYYYLLAVSGIKKDAIKAHTRIKIRDSHFIYEMQRRKGVVYTEDLLDRPELNTSQLMLKEAGQRSILNIPILMQDQLIGALNIASGKIDAFTTRDIESAEIVGRHLAIALQQAILFEAQENRARQLEAVRKSSLSLTQTLELENVLQAILRATLDLVSSAEFAHLVLYRDGRFTRQVAQDTHGNVRLEVPSPREGGFTEHIVQTRKLDYVDDIAESPFFSGSEDDFKGAILGLPLLIDEQVVGVMNIYYPDARSFDPHHTQVLRMISDHAAIAIQNARLFNAEREARLLQNTLLETTQAVSSSLNLEQVLDTFLARSADVLPFVSSSVLRYEAGRVLFLAIKGVNADKPELLTDISQHIADGPVLQTLIREQQPLIYGDVQQVSGWVRVEGAEYIRSWMGIPLIAGGEFIGTWNLDHDQADVYTVEHLRIAQALASTVASAIQNARLFEAQQLTLAQTNTLLDLTQSITATLELNETLDQFLVGSRTILEFSGSMILVREGEIFIPTAMLGYDDPKGLTAHFMAHQHESKRIPLFHQLISQREPLVISDVNASVIWRDIPDLPEVGSWIGVPLKVRGEFIGVWMLDHRQPGYYNDDHLRLASALAGPAAIAIKNAQFYQRQEQYTGQLELRVTQRTEALEASNRELEAFAYSVSHDLRAPLRAMEGFAAILRDDYLDKLDGQAQVYLSRITDAAQRMDHLINDLLVYSRISREEVHLLPVRLEPLILEITTLLETEISATNARIEVREPLPVLQGQRSVVQQVLINLISNAIKFTPDGVAPHITISGDQDGKHATIHVSDNGIGIAPEHQERIFQVFERLHGIESYPGTGIGLAIVKKGIERLGGQVGVKSAEGSGSQFWFKLPIGVLADGGQDEFTDTLAGRG